MAQNHIIIHPSYHEGLSNVCLEAAACGRPVLTTDIPGCRETIITQPQGSISGILFPAKDSSALVTAIESILSLTSTEREQLGKNGRHYVEQNFSRQIVVNTYMTATDSILGKQKKSDLSE